MEWDNISNIDDDLEDSDNTISPKREALFNFSTITEVCAACL